MGWAKGSEKGAREFIVHGWGQGVVLDQNQICNQKPGAYL